MPTCRQIYDGCRAGCDLTFEMTGMRELCKYGCLMSYAECVVGERILEIGEETVAGLVAATATAAEAIEGLADWVQQNPGTALGGIVLVGAIVLVCTSGPAGALILVAV